MQPPKNKTAEPTKAKRTSSLVSSNSLSSSPRVSLILALLLASYPQTAGAAPGKTSRAEDLRVSKKSLSNRNLQSDSHPPIMQRSVVKRAVVGALGRRDVWSFDFASILASFNPFNPQNGGFGMDGSGSNPGNGGGNGGNNGHTTTPHGNDPFPPTSTKKTSSTAHQQTTPAQPAASTTPHTSTTPLPAAMGVSGTNNEQISDTTDFGSETETESNGSATGTQSQTHSLTTGQIPPASPNVSPNNPGDNPPISMGSGGGPPPSSQSGSTRGLVIGLVVSLVLLLIICALAAVLFLRRLRKKRQERAASPYNEKAPWLAAAKTEPSDGGGFVSERTVTREGSVVSHAPSISSEPRMRARTPGGSSAVPVPYDPSEISDDVSAHFTFFPRDDSIGVPVPYPLALHIPARVAKAMAERDTRWQQYDNLERQPNLHGQSASIISDDLMTIPDRGSRRSTNTRRSMTDSMLSSGDGYYAPSQRLSSVQYGRHPDSQSELTRSDVGGHGDNPSIHGSENGDPLTSPISVADFPIPPPPAMARMHGSQSSNRRLRRTSAAASGGTSYSPRLLSVSENPFATNPDIDPSIDTDRSSDEDDGSRTPTPLGYDSRRLSGLSAVGGGSGAERVTMRASPARTTVLRQSNLVTNPFDDTSIVDGGDDRRVSSATAITEPGSIRDSEVYAGVIETVYAFPTPPDPIRRPSVS